MITLDWAPNANKKNEGIAFKKNTPLFFVFQKLIIHSLTMQKTQML